MTTIFDLLNPPRKNPDEYVEFISLDLSNEYFDSADTNFLLSRPTLNRCEALYRARDGRWILVYAPFPGETPLWVKLSELPEGVEPWEAVMPPNRELASSEVTRWLLMNEYPMPTDFRPVWHTEIGGDKSGISRLDHKWTAGVDSTHVHKSEGLGLTKSVSPSVSDESVVKSSGGDRKRNPPSAEAIMAYRLLALKGEKQVEIAKQLSKHFNRDIKQGTVSRYIANAKRWIKEGNVLPDLSAKTSKPIAVDPKRLELGKRTDGRTSRQRSDSDD